MAKNTKSTRQRRSSIDTGNPRSYSELIKQERDANVPVKATLVESTADNVNWSTEYAQVFSDLRQLLIISAVLIIAMIVLGFVL